MSLSKFCRGNVGRLLSADCLEAEVSARMYFVSFLGSRIHDPQEFLETFQATVEPSPYKIFGGKEKRTDATSHYHVLIVSEQALTLTNGIGGLRMWYNFDFQNEVDTYDIEIRVKRDEQYISSFRKHVKSYMLHVVDSATCFGDQSLSPFPAGGAESSMEREAEVDLGLFQIGDDAPAMATPIYPGTKSIPAFLGLNDCPPPCTFPCGCIGVYSGIETRSVASTHNRAREDEDHRAWCDQASCNWF
ncbi:hypothetical protein FOCG_16296 [Fusarium oxysporum f. sp. radicis-lycopersici 26381]|nr:hypothetical protein FOCG_16296 [Fusarium oxysporum f. sp. radicis-lycopersici 26381]